LAHADGARRREIASPLPKNLELGKAAETGRQKKELEPECRAGAGPNPGASGENRNSASYFVRTNAVFGLPIGPTVVIEENWILQGGRSDLMSHALQRFVGIVVAEFSSLNRRGGCISWNQRQTIYVPGIAGGRSENFKPLLAVLSASEIFTSSLLLGSVVGR